MKKDIFIDNNIAKNFSNPVDPEYKKLLGWLRKCDNPEWPDKGHCAHLVVSQKLLVEYLASSAEAKSGTSIPVLINLLTIQGRLNKFSIKEIEDFKSKHFKKHVEKNLQSNAKDRDHIPIVLMSHRKFAISIDDKFCHDLVNFPGFSATVVKKPGDLDYEN